MTFTGPLARPFEGLSLLLAASSSFQDAVRASDATEALQKIHYPYAIDEIIGTPDARPFAIITDDDSCSWNVDKNGIQRGSLLLTFEFLVESETVDNFVAFLNTVGAILEEMRALANTPTGGGGFYWNLRGYEKFTTPAICQREDFPNIIFYGATFVVFWES